MPNIISKKINIFYFLMSVLVILVHSLSNVELLNYFITTYIQPISVVPFFILSGFLFFRNVISINDVINKIKKRVYSLIVPYILWNIIYYIIYVIFRKNVSFSLVELTMAITNFVYNPTFWFLYQLIIMVLLTPVVFYILREKKYCTACVLIVLFILFIGGDIPYINEDAFIYFFGGAYIARYYQDKMYMIKPKSVILNLLIIFLGLIFICVTLKKFSIYSIYIHDLLIIFLIIRRFILAMILYLGLDYFCRYKSVPEYMKHSFFIYCFHYLIIRFFCNMIKLIRFLKLDEFVQSIVEIVLYTLLCVLVIIISNALYKFLYKRWPKFLTTLTGGR